MSGDKIAELSVPDALGFDCPLHGRCFTPMNDGFDSLPALNEAVVTYQALSAGDAKARRAQHLFGGCLPMIRKSLGRFCPYSRCYPGECLPRELLGETYVIFRRALDAYRPERGLDFLGFVSGRLRWGLRHELRRLRRSPPAAANDGLLHTGEVDGVEERVLARVWTERLLGELGESDANLLRGRYLRDLSHRELAAANGISRAAAQKRLERLRGRLRASLI